MAKKEDTIVREWLSREEVAQYLGLCVKSVKRLEDTGKIDARRIGSKIRISRTSIELMMQSQPTATETRHRDFQTPIAAMR